MPSNSAIFSTAALQDQKIRRLPQEDRGFALKFATPNDKGLKNQDWGVTNL